MRFLPNITNVNKATAAGTGAGFVGALAAYLAMKFGLPEELVLTALTAGFGFLARWAAKLNPDK